MAITHDIDCDMGDDCTCPAGEFDPPICPDCGERHHPPVFIRMGTFTLVVPRWAADLLELEDSPQVEHPELGCIEI